MAEPEQPMQAGDTARPAVPHRFSWLGLAGAALLVALLAVGLIEARQLAMLETALQPAEDGAALALARADADQQRLQEAWHLALQPEPSAADEARLLQRYAQWRDRLDALNAEAVRVPQAHDTRFIDLLPRLQGFRDRADAVLGPAAAQRGSPARAELAALQPALAELQEALAAQAEAAAASRARQLATRSQSLHTQARLGLAMTAFLALLTLAFAGIALRQLQALRERRAELEALASNLRQARREAEAASQAKSTFLANMSHEIRTPFHGLMGMLSLLREAGLNARQIDYLRTATESADHLLALLNDVLDMSQLESGQLSLAPAPVVLRALLRDVEALMRPQAAAKALALHFDADPAVPERVLLDATRVRQIVFNLLSNAIKFSERGAVVLDVRSRGEAGAARLEFIVTDTGPGMDEDTLQRLFSRFMQGDSSRQRRHGGNGLGLEISRNLARLMGGDISVRSKAGEGSIFTFWLPLRPVAELAPASGALGLAADLARPLRVLVAEDHPVNRQYLAALLENQHHLAHFTANGEEAVQAAREQPFDLVLMDLHMPVMDGIEATRAIRALGDRSRSTVPIVALTADVFPETQERCMAAGMNDYLTKPVSPQGLATCLRRLFGPAAQAADGMAANDNRQEARSGAGDAGLIDPAAMALTLQAMPAGELQRLIETYLAQGPDTVQRLRAAVRDAQPLELRVHAHAAKGAALNLGLTGLAATAQALHGGASHLPAHEIARLVQRFETQLAATREQLPQALAGAQAQAQAQVQAQARTQGLQTMTGSGSSRIPNRP